MQLTIYKAHQSSCHHVVIDSAMYVLKINSTIMPSHDQLCCEVVVPVCLPQAAINKAFFKTYSST